MTISCLCVVFLMSCLASANAGLLGEKANQSIEVQVAEPEQTSCGRGKVARLICVLEREDTYLSERGLPWVVPILALVIVGGLLIGAALWVWEIGHKIYRLFERKHRW